MINGIPQEIKNNEYRVAPVSAGAGARVKKSRRLLVERAAGEGSGISDEEYLRAG